MTTRNLSTVTSKRESTITMSPMYLTMNSGTQSLASHRSLWHSDEFSYVTVSDTVTMTMCAPIRMFPSSKFMTKIQRGARRTSLLHNKVPKTRRLEATARRPKVHNANFTPVFSPIIPGQHVLFVLEATQMTLIFFCLFSHLASTHECLGNGESFMTSSLMSIASLQTG